MYVFIIYSTNQQVTSFTSRLIQPEKAEPQKQDSQGHLLKITSKNSNFSMEKFSTCAIIYAIGFFSSAKGLLWNEVFYL